MKLTVANIDSDDAGAPRCNTQSVKPPVEAPASSTRKPTTSMPNTSSA